MEKPKESTKTIKASKRFSKVARYKINVPKLSVFLYINMRIQKGSENKSIFPGSRVCAGVRV